MHFWICLMWVLRAAWCGSTRDLLLCTSQFTCYSEQYGLVNQDCSHKGVLTAMETQPEIDAILHLVSHTRPTAGQHRFRIGLQRSDSVCVDPKLPLRGYFWSDGGHSRAEIPKWLKEAKSTCVDFRCVDLQVTTNDSGQVQDWGWEETPCHKNRNVTLICKHKLKDICNPAANMPGLLYEKTLTPTLKVTNVKQVTDVLSLPCPTTKETPVSTTTKSTTTVSLSEPPGYPPITSISSSSSSSSSAPHNTLSRSNIFIPVLLGIVLVILLTVIVLGVFKCCFRKKSRTLKADAKPSGTGELATATEKA